MPNNFFITGMPRSGKTTLLRRIAKRLREQGLKVGGFISPEEAEHGTRTGFIVEDLGTGKKAILADINIDGPKVAKYHVDIKSFEAIALPGLAGFKGFDVIIVDEIGMMELKSQKFSDLLDSVLDSETPLIASLHNDLIERYGPYGEVLYLTEDTREFVYTDLVRKVASIKEAKRRPQIKAPAEKKPQAAAQSKKGPEEKPAEKQKEERKPQKVKIPESKKSIFEEALGEENEEGPEEKEEEEQIPEKKEEKKKGKKKGFMDSLVDLLGL